jgi:hypothetical protein
MEKKIAVWCKCQDELEGDRSAVDYADANPDMYEG